MTPNQREVLVGIQALALAVPKQTGLRIRHEVRADIHHSTGQAYTVSEVRIVDRNLKQLHKTVVQIDEDGHDDPPTLLYLPDDIDYGERTLTQQRDELVEFIATHRKQEAAA